MNNNKFFLSTIVILFFSCFLSSQTSVIDSLKQVLDTISVERKAGIYNRMFDNAQHYTKDDTSLIFAKKALEYSEKNNDDKQKAGSLKNIGYFYLTKSRFDSAFLYFNKAIPLLENNKDNENLIDVYFDLARIYMNQGKLNKASEEIFKALKISEKNNLLKQVKEANQGLGIVYYNLGEYDNAMNYLQKALDYELGKKIKDNGAISRLYQNFGLVNYGKKDYKKALEFYFKALKLQQNGNSLKDQMIITNSIALCYSEMKNHDKALEYFKKALVLANKTGNPHLIVSAQLNIGKTLMHQGKYKQAITEINKGLDIAKKYRFTKWIRNGYNYLYNCYNYLDDAANALINYQKYRKYDDSLKIEGTKQKIAEIESKYESEKKDKQIQLLAKDNEIKSVKLKRRSTLMYAVIAFALLGLIFSLIFFRLLRQRQKARELIKQQEAELKFTENLRNYYKLANMLPLVVFFVDKNKKINYINEFGLNLFNINEEKIKNGLEIHNIIVPINKDDFQKDISKAFENKNISEKEYKFNIEGEKHYFIGFLSPNVENNTITGILGVMLDITRIRKMQKEIELTAINTENKERKRFSADLHDGLGPLLSSIKLFISGLESASEDEKNEIINYVKELIDDSIKSVRIISNNILPVSLTEKGLIDAIQSFGNKLKTSKGIDIEIEKINIDDYHFSTDAKLILFRVLQELINNTIKHAGASKINIKFEKCDNDIHIRYCDNGKGFDFEKIINSDDAGLGLKNILNRIKTLGGDISFTSKKDKGLIVDIILEM